jgi:sec-independent protein translocase protein TatA
MTTPLAIGMPGMAEWIMIAAIGLLIFGKRLPEVGRSLGKGIVEFKKGLKGVEDEVTQVDQPKLDQPQPKFDPLTGKPLQAKFDPYTGKPVGDSNSSPT